MPHAFHVVLGLYSEFNVKLKILFCNLVKVTNRKEYKNLT